MNKIEFESISWPEEFYVQFTNGQEQLFVSTEGISWDSGCNNEGANQNRPSISCCWNKKSPSQQRYKLIEFFVDEVVAIKSTNGNLVWKGSGL